MVCKFANKRPTEHSLVGQKKSRRNCHTYGTSLVVGIAYEGRYDPQRSERGEVGWIACHYDAEWGTGHLCEGR